MTIQTGYSITKTALKALSEEQRVDKYAKHVDLLNGRYCWFTFVAASTALPDDINILMPDDEPEAGRWIGDDGASVISCGGKIVCFDDCPTDGNGLYYCGKVFEFYCAQSMRIIIKPRMGLSITSGDASIQLFRWSQLPNTALTGRGFVAELPHTGGSAFLEIDSSHRWISIFARDPGDSNRFNGTCFVMNGNTATLLSF